jgi:hypothetical protein
MRSASSRAGSAGAAGDPAGTPLNPTPATPGAPTAAAAPVVRAGRDRTKALLLLLAGTVGGLTAGIPVPQAMVQSGSLGFVIALGFVLGDRDVRRRAAAGRWVRTRWLVLVGAAWGAVVGELSALGVLSFEYGAHSNTFGFHYPMTNTFGQTIHGFVPGVVTGVFMAVAMGLAFVLLKEDERMWFAIPWAIPLGWWTGAESLAVGQALGHLNWDYVGPAQIQGMRFGIAWMEAMLIFRWAYLRANGDLVRMRAEIRAADDAKWAAAKEPKRSTSGPA